MKKLEQTIFLNFADVNFVVCFLVPKELIVQGGFKNINSALKCLPKSVNIYIDSLKLNQFFLNLWVLYQIYFLPTAEIVETFLCVL